MGAIGQVLRPRLRARGILLHSTDIAAFPPIDSGEKASCGDLRNPAVVDAVLAGTASAIHLAGSSVERPLPEIIENNLVALHELYEGARRHGLRRVIFASSNHAIGMYPSDMRLSLTDPTRPDGLYGLSKVWGEAMGRLYWDKHGIETVAIRIGSALPRPTQMRHLATWLGHDDLEQLIHCALSAPALGFLTVWGVSANTRSWWDNGDAAKLGYAPRQNAETFIAEILAQPDPLGPVARYFQGGDFAAADFSRTLDCPNLEQDV
jgi:uronate dehydrogenase